MATTSVQTPSAPPLGTKETFHFLNSPQDTVNEALTGLTHLNHDLSYDSANKIVYRNDLQTFGRDHVTIVGCGGAGHEPMFCGFVGPNYLSAAVSGSIFASPTGRQMLAAIKMCQPVPSEQKRGDSKGRGGTILVMGSYTGDVLHAGQAITRAKAGGYGVRIVAVGDDVAVGRSKGAKVGRRGLSGHLIVLKVGCALAEQGKGLDEVVEAMNYVAANLGTIGVAFDRVALPNAAVTELPLLPPDTVELGMGAHGEPGLQQISPIPPPHELTRRMVNLLIDTTDPERSFIPFPSRAPNSEDSEVILLVNSFGGTSTDVLGCFAELAIDELKRNGIAVKRLIAGPMVTSLKMSGFSLTLWRLPTAYKEGILDQKKALELWDSPVKVAAWKQ